MHFRKILLESRERVSRGEVGQGLGGGGTPGTLGWLVTRLGPGFL